MAARKSKHQVESAAATLDDIQSLGDRVSEWISNNPAPILGSAAVVLVIAAIYGFVVSSRESAAEDASASLATVESEYRRAMGAEAGVVEITEPANPETALGVRTEYVERFRSVAEEHQGTSAEALALLEAGQLQAKLGDTDAALATWREAVAGRPQGDSLRALIVLRIASTLEQSERWSEAAAAYEDAAASQSFPLRFSALLDAARCRAEAGEVDLALAAYATVESEAPDQAIPQHLAARVSEIRASR